MAGNCTDTDLIELIARNVVFKLLSEHTLQAGLRSCGDTCDWIGHETKVATCAQLEAALQPGNLGDTIEDFTYDPDTGQLTIFTDQGQHAVVLPTLADMDDVHAVSLVLGVDNNLRLTLSDGTILTTSMQPLVDIVEALTDRFLRLVGYDASTHTMTFEVGTQDGTLQTFTINLSDLIPITVAPDVCLDGVGTAASPLSLDIQCLASRLASLVNTAVVVGDGCALTGDGTTDAPLCINPVALGGQVPVAVCPDGALSGNGTTTNPLCLVAGQVPITVGDACALTGDGTDDFPLCVDTDALAGRVGVVVGEDCGLVGTGTVDNPLCVDPDALGQQVAVAVGEDCGLTGDGTAENPLCIDWSGRVVSGDDCIVVTELPSGAVSITLAGCGAGTDSTHDATIAVSPGSAPEGSSFTYTITLDSPVAGTALALSVALSGDEQVAHGYSSPRTVVIGVGQSTGSFVVATVNDAAGGAATSLTATIQPHARLNTIGAPATATLTAVAAPDSIHYVASVVPVDNPITEGEDACWLVTVSGTVSGSSLSISFTLSGTEFADHSYSVSPLVIPVGQNSGTVCVTTIDDDTAGNRQLCLQASTSARVTSVPAKSCITVEGTGVVNSTHTIVSLTAHTTPITEGQNACWDVVVSGTVTGTPLPITTTLSGSEQNAHHYAAPTVYIPVGQNSGQFCVATVDDESATNTSLCAKVNASGRIAAASSRVCIAVNGSDVASPTASVAFTNVSAPDYDIVEGGTLNMRITLSTAAPVGGVSGSVTFSGSEKSSWPAAYPDVAWTVSSGNTYVDKSVVTYDDAIAEAGNTALYANLSVSTAGWVVGISPAAASILNNDSGGGGGCFLLGTEMSTPDGYVSNADLHVGDTLAAYQLPGMLTDADENWAAWTTLTLGGMEFVTATVRGVSTFVATRAVRINGGAIVTPDHRYFTRRGDVYGWCEAQHLDIHAALVTTTGAVAVTQIEMLSGEFTFVALDVTAPDTLIAHTPFGDVLAHNLKCADCPGDF